MNLRNIQSGRKVQVPEGYKVQKPGKLNLCEGACDKTCKRGRRRRREEDTHTVQETASKRQGLTWGNTVGEEQDEKGGRRPQMELGY